MSKGTIWIDKNADIKNNDILKDIENGDIYYVLDKDNVYKFYDGVKRKCIYSSIELLEAKLSVNKFKEILKYINKC